MKTVKLFLISAMLASSATVISAVKDDAVDSVLENLDLTSFPNSTGPRRVSGKKTFSDYGFSVIRKDRLSAYMEMGSHEWAMSFDVLSMTDSQMTICFRDRARNGGSYNAVSALSLSKSPEGMWTGKQLERALPNCRNAPTD
ncbi:pesticin immunity protein [Sphingobium yanoikuyae]|jgi:hypothetical protein|uniref:Pesticin immunity protein n=1 Tax=Sphingobium yanoikuyae TaxID=13690 RepID=A0A3G2UVN2_SPHYA|nr:pesticin immunity protein [Sphingobium yanoikuyae]